jgi:hypothetical protein
MLFYGCFSSSSDAGHIRVNVESIALDIGQRELPQPQTPSETTNYSLRVLMFK